MQRIDSVRDTEAMPGLRPTPKLTLLGSDTLSAKLVKTMFLLPKQTLPAQTNKLTGHLRTSRYVSRFLSNFPPRLPFQKKVTCPIFWLCTAEGVMLTLSFDGPQAATNMLSKVHDLTLVMPMLVDGAQPQW